VIDAYLNNVYGVYPLPNCTKEKITLHANAMITNYFRAQKIHESQHVEMQSRGDSIITFELIPSMELVSLILSYGKQIRVLKTPRLQPVAQARQRREMIIIIHPHQ